MAKPKTRYIGDGPMRRLLERYDCPFGLHVVRMRLWGEIVSPRWDASPIKTIESLWPEGLPTFESTDEANRFFGALMGLWNRMARHQDGKPPLRLTAIDVVRTRDDLRAAASLRVEELLDGFTEGFTGGEESMDVPSGVGDLVTRVEKGIELLATARNTFSRPPGPDDAEMVAEFVEAFGEIDRAVQADLNAIAVAVKAWRRTVIGDGPGAPWATSGGRLH